MTTLIALEGLTGAVASVEGKFGKPVKK